MNENKSDYEIVCDFDAPAESVTAIEFAPNCDLDRSRMLVSSWDGKVGAGRREFPASSACEMR